MATTDEIMGYVLNSPHNTNPNVLKDMLNEQGGGGSIICNLTFEMRESAPVITATMTAGELWSALQSGSSLLFRLASGTSEMFSPLQLATFDQSGYTFDIIVGEQTFPLVAGNAEGYPSNGGGNK